MRTSGCLPHSAVSRTASENTLPRKVPLRSETEFKLVALWIEIRERFAKRARLCRLYTEISGKTRHDRESRVHGHGHGTSMDVGRLPLARRTRQGAFFKKASF